MLLSTECTCMQKEDPGKLVMLGYSAGARGLKLFHWYCNLLCSTLTEEQICDLDYRGSGAFALAWNMGRRVLPKEVIEDINGFITRLGIFRMDANSCMQKTYFIDIGGERHEFSRGELAPASGAMGLNYSRWVIEFCKFIVH